MDDIDEDMVYTVPLRECQDPVVRVCFAMATNSFRRPLQHDGHIYLVGDIITRYPDGKCLSYARLFQHLGCLMRMRGAYRRRSIDGCTDRELLLAIRTGLFCPNS